MSCTMDANTGSNCYLKSLERVHNYPIVNDSFLYALSYYQWAKSKNTVLDATLSKMEETLKTVKEKTEPIAASKLHYFDETVCSQLERFEKLCPIILKPSKTITNIPSDIFHQRIEPSLQKVVQPVKSTLGLVSRTSCAAASIMSSTLTQVIPSAMLPIQTTNNVLNKTEQLLDKYFPAQDGDNFDQCSKQSDCSVYGKIKRLSTKTQHRIYKKVLRDIDHFRSTSLMKLEQIYSVLQEIKNTRSTMSGLTDNIRYNQLIMDGLQYSEHLQHLITSTVQAMPKFLCTNAASILDLFNDKLFYVRNTIQESTNRGFVSEKRVNQAADSIDFVRSWIEYITDNLKEYYSKFEKEDNECKLNDDDFSGSSSIEDNTDDDDENNQE